MEPKKRWDGYTSWSFLEPDVDYRPFDLEPQIGRVPPFVYPLDSDQHDRADRLLSDCVCISLHDHCGITPRDMAENDAYVRQGREWYGYEGLAASGLDAVFENFMDGTATITSKTGWWTDVIHDPRDAPRRRGAPVGRVRRLERAGHPRRAPDRPDRDDPVISDRLHPHRRPRIWTAPIFGSRTSRCCWPTHSTSTAMTTAIGCVG
jgi:hypothetical protein